MSLGEIPEGQGRSFSVGDRRLAIFFVRGRYYALDDCCPHMGASLGVGDVYEDTVVCDRHMWAFKLSDGSCVDAPALKAETFQVRVEGDDVQVRVPSEE